VSELPEPAVDPHAELLRSLLGATVGERYVIERLLGRGGMGLVLEARHRELEQKVAIKVILPEYAANNVVAARFMREAKLAARVTGRHLVRVFDVGRLASGMPYLVMELLSGNDLDAEVARRGPLPVEEAVDYIVQAALGLAELHTQGVVHRDLKPSNLFISNADGERTIKILDFGISKEAPGHVGPLTGTDAAIGTPSYMSPEQIKAAKDVDARSDIWSLGVILAELLTQRLPFPSEGVSVGELFGIILFRDPVPPNHRRPDLPTALSDVVLRCLSKDPGGRYRDVAELAEALRPFASRATEYRIEAVRRAIGPVTAVGSDVPTLSLAPAPLPLPPPPPLAEDTLPTPLELMPLSDATQLSGPAPAPGMAAISRPAGVGMGVTGRSLATSTRNVSSEAVPVRPWSRLVFAALAGCSVLALSVFAFLHWRAASEPPSAGSAAALSDTPTPSASAKPHADFSVPMVEPQASPSVALSSASTSAAAAANAANKRKPAARPKAAPPPAPGDDLILDRR
jgi:serine/threonine-protein kinase